MTIFKDFFMADPIFLPNFHFCHILAYIEHNAAHRSFDFLTFLLVKKFLNFMYFQDVHLFLG